MKKLLFACAFFTHLIAYAQFPNTINFTQLPASSGHILDVVDYNNDSYEDLVYQNGPSGNFEIYYNNFGSYNKVTADLGFPVITGNGMGTEGVVSFDYNNDGYQDLLFISAGTSGYFRLFKNNCGSSFTEVSTAMNMPINPNVASQYLNSDPIVLISDYDKDNDLDIVYVRDVSGDYRVSALVNGGSSFGAPVDLFAGFGSTLPIISFINYDNDLDDDLLLIKNTSVKQSCEILLYANNGTGTFNLLSTTGLTNSSPVGFANITDYNQDGYSDIMLGTKDTVSPGPSNQGLKVFMNNNGLGTFTDQSSFFNTMAGNNADYYRSHFFDVNNDGFIDVLWEVRRNDSIASAAPLMVNDGFNFFTNENSNLIPLAIVDTSTNLKYTVFDYDNNGDMDIFVPGTASNAKMLFNNTSTFSNYLSLSLYSCSGTADPIGARIYVKAGAFKAYKTYTSQGISSDGMAKSEKVHIGLGTNSFIDSLVVYWPDGTITVRTNFLANNHYKIVNGTCEIAEPLVFDLGNDSIVFCNVDTVNFFAPNGYRKYLWSTGDTTIGTKVTETGWLYCTVFFYGNCTLLDSIYVRVAEGKIVQNDTTIIKGSSLQLDASPRYDCSPFGAQVKREVSASEDLGPTVRYVATLNGHHYYVFNNPSDWSTAQRDALALGGNLVVINNQEENDFLAQQPFLNNLNLWIGLYRTNNPGDPYRWVNCEPLDYTNWSLLFNSPSSIPNEQYVYMRATGCVDSERWKNTDETQFSPDPCESGFFGVIEFDNATATSYLWNTSETSTSITVSPTTSSIYFVEVNQNNNSCFDPINVTVLDPSTLLDTDSLFDCNSPSIMLTANTEGWESYLWNTGDTSRSIMVSQTGWYTITAAYGNSFGSDSIYVFLAKNKILTPDTTVCTNSEVYILGPVLPFTNQQAHRQNFEAGIFTNYSSTDSFTYNGTKVFGPFANDSVTYTMNAIPRHDSITVSFDLYLHDSWEGNCATVGEDRFKFMVNNNTLLNETFSNSLTCNQSYSSTGISGSYPAFTGAVASGLPQRCLSGSSSSKYTITKSFAHSASSLVFSWLGALRDTSANLGKCNESWSLDNIVINYRIPTKVLWSTGDTTQNIMVTATNPSTDYWIRVPIGSNGIFCFDTVTVNSSNSVLPPNLIEEDSVLGCNTTVFTTLSMPIGQSKYRWSNGDTLFSTNIYNEGWYYAYVEDAIGCTAFDSVYYNKNKFSLSMSDTTICPGSPLTIESFLNNNATTFPGPTATNYIAAQALSGFTYLGEFRGHHYYIANTTNSWESSLQKAFGAGGYLACINDTFEQKFIESITDSNVWIGLFKNRSGYYEWANKDTLIYKNWGSSEPSASPKDYVYIKGNSCSENGKWASHLNTDPLATDPCEKDAYGLLEISSLQYSYVWSTGALTKDISVNPTTAQNISLVVSKTENNHTVNCLAGEVNVSMNPAPVIVGSALNCIGSSVSYTTLLKPGRSYFWEVVGGTLTSGQFSNRIRVNWDVAGVGYVLVSDSVLSTQCKTVSDTFHTNTIEVLTPNIAGLTSVCENQTTDYSIPFDPELGMNWTINGGAIINGLGTENITVEWGPAGTGNLGLELVHTASGCSAPQADLFVDILTTPVPVISGTDTVCENTSATYSSPFNTGRKYHWTVSGGSITSGQETSTITVLWNTSGIGTLSLMDSILATGCFVNTSDFEVVINTLPAPVISGNNSVCESVISTYSIPSNIGRTYRWSVNGGTIIAGQGTSSVNVVWGGSGSGDIQVSDSVNASGCKALSSLFNVSINTIPQPIVSGKDAICQGATATYSIPSLSGHTYKWTVTLGSIVSGQGTASISVLWPISGSGTVEVTDSINVSGCKGTSPLMAVSITTNPNPVITGKQTVCAGESISYSTPSNTGRSYIWNVNNGSIVSGQGTATINVLWASAGSSFVVVTDSVNATGCAVRTSNYDVTVEANPSPVITGKNDVCSSTIQAYSIPSNTGRTYNWNVSNGTIVAGQGTSDIQVLWGAFGSGSITVSDSIDASGCVGYAPTFNVNINILPSPVVSGPTSACVNSVSSYNIAPSLGRTYTWLVSGGTITSGLGTAGIEVSWTSAGTGSIQVIDSVDATGCTGVSSILNVLIQPKPSTFVSGANSICENGTAMYGTIYNSNKYYEWGIIGGNINMGQGTSNISVTWTVPGTGYVYLTDSLVGSNCSAYAFLGVSVNPIPQASFTAAQSAGGVKLTPDEANVSCTWYFGDGDSSYLYSPYHAYASNGTYTVTLYTRSIYGCLNQSTMDVNISTVGLDGDMFSRNFKFNAQPNPFTEQTNLSLTLQESADISMDVYDMSGRLIHSFVKEQNHKAGTYTFPFQAAEYQTAGGVYLVRLKVGEEIRNLRIVEIGR